MILTIHNEKEREILLNALIAQEDTGKLLVLDQVAHCAENSHRFNNLDQDEILYLWELSARLDMVVSLKERVRMMKLKTAEPPMSDQEL